MNTAFPLVAIAIALVALALSPPATRAIRKAALIPAIALILLVGIGGFLYKADYSNLLSAAIAAVAGIAISIVLDAFGAFRLGSGAAAAGFAAALSGFAGWLDPAHREICQLALVFGLAIGGLIVERSAEDAETGLPIMTACLTAVAIAGDFMGRKAMQSDTGGLVGTMFMLAASMGAFVGLLLNRSEKRATTQLGFVPGWCAVLILMILGYVIGSRIMESQQAWMIFDASVLAAAILNWVVRPSEKVETYSFMVASVIWIALATLAFSYQKGLGIAIAAAGASATLLLLGNARALLSAGPLVGLAYYRVLREAQPDASRALDIGQHYAVIGLAIGCALALLPTEWLATRVQSGFRSQSGRLLWALVLGLAPVGLAVVLGAKGIVGFVAGLGFAALIEGLKGGNSLIPIALSGGIASLVVVSYGWLANLLDMTRESKQVAFYWIAGSVLVFGLLISLVSRVDAETESK